jgi:uncharacterized membrane protein
MDSKNIPEKWKFSPFDRINSFQKLFICIAIAVAAYFIVEIKNIDLLTHVMIGWDTFSLCMIIMSWVTFFITTSKQIREQARIQDQAASIIFILILISTTASFLAVLLLLVVKHSGNETHSWRLPIAIAGMIFSWFLIHTIFTLRYAHIYYGDHPTTPDKYHGGLSFPDNATPEYIDFAYFSFVLGMTFQVSDVQITSKRFRKLALWHSLLSFGFNTIMIALTINVIAGYGN